MKLKNYMLGGKIHGPDAEQYQSLRLDTGYMRPFVGRNNKTYATIANGFRRTKKGKRKVNFVNTQLANAEGIFLFDEWKEFDRAVQEAPRNTLQAFADLQAAASFNIPNGMGVTFIESYMRGDITPATVHMDALTLGDSDRPLTDLAGIPLPIISKDFVVSLRDLEVSRRSGMPFDTTMPADMAVKVMEEVEKLTVGVGVNYMFAGKALYGYLNFPQRLTVELSDPEDPSWTGSDLVADFIEMREASKAVGYKGPWRVYTGSGWDAKLDLDTSAVKGSDTLRERLLKIRGIRSIDTLDYMPEWDIVFVQMDPRVARAVVALPLQTVQWNVSPFEAHMKVLTIAVPWLRHDFYGGTGIVHGSVTGSGSS